MQLLGPTPSFFDPYCFVWKTWSSVEICVQCNDATMWKQFKEVIACGLFGCTYAEINGRKDVVLKISLDHPNYEAEFQIALEMGLIGVGPRVHQQSAKTVACRSVFDDRIYYGFIMDRMTMSLKDWFESHARRWTSAEKRKLTFRLAEKFEKMWAAGYQHNDVHAGNIMLKCMPGSDNLRLEDVFIIDFGKTTRSPSHILDDAYLRQITSKIALS